MGMLGGPARHRRWMRYAVGAVLWVIFIIIAYGYVLGGFIAGWLEDIGKRNAAIVVYRAALRIYPWNAPNRNDLGLTLLSHGDVDEAIVELGKAVELAPKVPRYHNALGVALLRKGKVDEAIRYFREAVRLDPDYTDPKRNLEIAISEKDKQ